jgi:hypothetical protein
LAVAAVAFLLLRALRKRDERSFGLAGAATGLSLHLYFPARAVLLIAPAVFAYGVLSGRIERRAALRAAVVFSIAAGLAFAPLAVNAGLANWAGRSQAVTMFHPATWESRLHFWQVDSAWDLLRLQVLEGLKMFTEWADLAVLHRSPAGLLDPITLALVLLGASMALLAAQPAGLFLIVWFLLVFVLGVVITDAPRASYRLAPAMPALVLLAASALQELWNSTGPARGRVHGAVRIAVLVALLSAVAATNAWLFFVRYPRGDGKQVTMSEAVRYASRICGQRHVRIVPGQASWPRETLALFCADLAPASASRAFPADGKPLTLLLVENWDRYRREIEQRFPGVRVRTHVARDGRVLFLSVEIPPMQWAQEPAPAPLLASSDSYKRRYSAAERCQEKSCCMARPTMLSQRERSEKQRQARRTASKNAARVHGSNVKPVPCAGSESASMTVSASPPVRCTTGSVP